MNKLVNYIFLLLSLISLVYITKEVITFTKDILILRDHQAEATIRQNKMLYSVVRVTHLSYVMEPGQLVPEELTISSATGFSIQYNPYSNISFVLSNDHFCRSISDSSVITLETFDMLLPGSANDYFYGEILYSDPKLDLCLIAANGYIRPAEIAEYDYNVQPFEEIFIIGAPSGNFPIIIDTYISTKERRSRVGFPELSKDGNDFLLISEEIFPGHSGSPVYNKGGEVIGVVFAAMPTYGGFAISHRDIYKFIGNHNTL